MSLGAVQACVACTGPPQASRVRAGQGRWPLLRRAWGARSPRRTSDTTVTSSESRKGRWWCLWRGRRQRRKNVSFSGRSGVTRPRAMLAGAPPGRRGWLKRQVAWTLGAENRRTRRRAPAVPLGPLAAMRGLLHRPLRRRTCGLWHPAPAGGRRGCGHRWHAAPCSTACAPAAPGWRRGR